MLKPDSEKPLGIQVLPGKLSMFINDDTEYFSTN